MTTRKPSPFNRLQGHRTVQHGFAELKPQTPSNQRYGTGIYSTSRWQKLSVSIRKAHPFCAQCGLTSTQTQLFVDHIIELKDDASLAFEPSNLIVLCHACHMTNTRAVAKTRAWAGTADEISKQLEAYESQHIKKESST